MCMLDESFGPKVRHRTFGGAVLFILMSRVLL